MEGMVEEGAPGSDTLLTWNGVVFIDLPFMITQLCDFEARNSIRAHESAVAQRDSKFWAPGTDADMIFISSMNALTRGKLTPAEEIKFGASASKVYSVTILMPAKNRIIDNVYPAKMPRQWRCQLLEAEAEKDLLNIAA